MATQRNVIVHIAASADGYIARPDGDLEWLTSRPAPEGFYGMSAFMRSIDTKLIRRQTYEVSRRLGAKFDSANRTIVFSRHAPPADVRAGVEFVKRAIGPFVSRLREQPGKDIWLMGGGDLIASFVRSFVRRLGIRVVVAGAALLASTSGCGDCAGVGLTRLGETERTVAVGQSFVATYEEGGSCSNTFGPVAGRARWTSEETAIVDVDSLTGRITGKSIGDALVVPNRFVTTGPWSLLVHVR